MPVATLADYLGRTTDLLAFAGAQEGSEQRLEMQLVLPSQGGALIAGIQKLVQRFLLELLTEKGSMRYLPSRGSTFLIDLHSSRWRTPADVTASFSAALVDVRRNLIGEESEADPPDERFLSASLLSVGLAQDQVRLSIQVVSRAETSRTVLYPLPVVNFAR